MVRFLISFFLKIVVAQTLYIQYTVYVISYAKLKVHVILFE